MNARDQFVDDHTERVQVRSNGSAPSTELFWRHVGGRAAYARCGQSAQSCPRARNEIESRYRKTEIGNYYPNPPMRSLWIDQEDVSRFEVPVNHSRFMRLVQSVSQLPDHRCRTKQI